MSKYFRVKTLMLKGEKGERGTGIRSVELRDDYSLLFTLENGETLETTAILGKELENIRTLEASASSASKTATSASESASASAQSASKASISASESASNASASADTATSKATEASTSATKAKESETNAKQSETNASNSAKEAKASADSVENVVSDVSKLKEDLSNKITKFYASNQGETHITDSDNGKIQDMMIYGMSSQFTTTGKNLANGQNIYCFINSSANVCGVASNNDTGMAIDVSKLTNVTISTKSIQDRYRAGCTDTVPIKGSTVTCYNGINKDGTKSSYTIDTTDYNYLIVNATKIEDIQVEKGSEATSYEPYTGGAPSPSPNYPQEIKKVVNPTIKVTNEDGLNVQSFTLNNITLNAIPVSSGGNVTINGQQYIADYVDVERGKLVRCVYEIEVNGEDKSFVQASQYCNYSVRKLPNAKEKEKEVIYSLSSFFSEPVMFNKEFGLLYIIKTNYAQVLNDCAKNKTGHIMYALATPIETDLTPEEITAFKALATYYPVTKISVNSEQLDGYTVFNYPISMANGWNYVKQQLNDNRDYIYDMDLQSAEAYVNSEYAVTLTELGV